MTISLVQTDGTAAAGCVDDVLCSGNSNNTGDTESNQASESGTPGTTPRTITLDVSAADLNCIWMECAIPDGASGAGVWTIPIRISTGNHQVVLDEIHVCKVDSSCNNISSLGSLTGIGDNIASAATYSNDVTCSSTTFSAGQKVVIIFAFDIQQLISRPGILRPSHKNRKRTFLELERHQLFFA